MEKDKALYACALINNELIDIEAGVSDGFSESAIALCKTLSFFSSLSKISRWIFKLPATDDNSDDSDDESYDEFDIDYSELQLATLDFFPEWPKEEARMQAIYNDWAHHLIDNDGVPDDVRRTELKNALKKNYRPLQLKYHPDKNTDSKEQSEAAEVVFKKLAPCYEFMMSKLDSDETVKDALLNMQLTLNRKQQWENELLDTLIFVQDKLIEEYGTLNKIKDKLILKNEQLMDKQDEFGIELERLLNEDAHLEGLDKANKISSYISGLINGDDPLEDSDSINKIRGYMSDLTGDINELEDSISESEKYISVLNDDRINLRALANWQEKKNDELMDIISALKDKINGNPLSLADSGKIKNMREDKKELENVELLQLTAPDKKQRGSGVKPSLAVNSMFRKGNQFAVNEGVHPGSGNKNSSNQGIVFDK